MSNWKSSFCSKFHKGYSKAGIFKGNSAKLRVEKVERKKNLIKVNMSKLKELQIETSKYFTLLGVAQDKLLFYKLFQKISEQLNSLAALMTSSKSG